MIIGNGTHIVLDLETLSTQRTALIVSIGAAAFNWPWEDRKPETFKTFYAPIDISMPLPPGFTMDGDTVSWWMRQGPQARAVFDDATHVRYPLAVALAEFAKTVNAITEGGATLDKPVYLWGNGSDFDCTIIEHAYRLMGQDMPVNFRSYRCFRTINDLAHDFFTDEQLVVKDPQLNSLIEHRADHDALLAAIRLARIFWNFDKLKRRDSGVSRGVALPTPATLLEKYFPIPELMVKFRSEGVTGNNLDHWQCSTCGEHITVENHQPPYLKHYHPEWADQDAAHHQDGGEEPTRAYVNQE